MYRHKFVRKCTPVLLMGMLALLLATAGGCARRTLHKGVLNTWRDESLPPFEKGHTTQAEIIKLLGPPSQVIGLNDQVVLYYLFERSTLRSFYLGVYNRSDQKITFDRAVFFFDQQGILTDHSYSIERIPYAKKK